MNVFCHEEDYFEKIKPYMTELWNTDQDFVSSVLEQELGEGRKLSSATDKELVALDNIYNQLVTKATLLGIEV